MKTLLAFLAFSALSFAQPPTRFLQGTAAAASGDCDAAAELGGVHIQTGNPASVATRVSVCVQTGASTYSWNPVGHKVATTAPATCVTGEMFFDSDASAGSNWYGCTSANTWTALGGGGGSGDIEGVTAGNGISGGGTSGTVTVTNAAPLYGCTDTGGDDAYVCAPTGFPVAYATDQKLLITFTTANTGAATIDAGPGAKAIKLPGGSSDPATGDIVALKPMIVRYDETANGAAGAWILAGTACGTGLVCTGGTPAVDPTQVGFLGTASTWSALQTFSSMGLPAFASITGTSLTSGGIVCATSTTAFGMSAALSANNYVVGGGAGACPAPLDPAFTTQTDGATITWAIASAVVANATVTLGGNRTLNITNPKNGGSYVLRVVQDGTGSRTLTLGTGCTWKVSGGGAGAITPTTTAGAIDVLAFTYDGTNCYANFAKNFN